MRKIIFVFLLTTILLIVFTANVLAIDVNRLVEKSELYDGKKVVFEGEVVGDVMVRGNYSWINVYDGVNAMGIWIRANEAEKIKKTGDYKNKGDFIEVEGVFNRACKEHGGDMDIHGKNLIVRKAGYGLTHPVGSSKVFFAAGLAVLSGIMFLFERHIQRKRLTKEGFVS